MIRRTLIFVHRWLGVALCLLFLLWFPSGIAMMYVQMPGVSLSDRLAHAPALQRSFVNVAPADAARRLGVGLDRLRLASFDGRPAYRAPGARGVGGRVLFADTGEEQGEIPHDMLDRIASAWTGLPAAAARVEELTAVDQWTLQIPLASLAPVFKYSWADGRQVYVSQASGDVVQDTTRASRFGAYLGPIPHWFYVTALRRHGQLWSRIVIWTSGIGTAAAIIGLAVGLWMFSPSKRYLHMGVATSIPYRGQKRWHTIFGLAVGVAAATYAFSGMLSMDPFPYWVEEPRAAGRAAEAQIDDLLGGRVDPSSFDSKHPREALRQLGDVAAKELAFTSFGGEAYYLAYLDGGDSRIVPMQGAPRDGFDLRDIQRALPATAGFSSVVLDRYDRYYLDRTNRLPLPVVLVRGSGGAGARIYIDPRTARVVHVYHPSGWANRWLYHGLHSLDFPWLYAHRPLWDIVVIALMMGGTALSVTSIVLAWRTLGRTLRGGQREPNTRRDTSEDLA